MILSQKVNQLLQLKISLDFQLLAFLFLYGIVKGIEFSFGFSLGFLTFIFFGLVSSLYFIKTLFSRDVVKQAKGFLFVSFFGNDYYFFIYGVILLIYAFIIARSIKITSFNFIIVLFLLYAACVSVVNLISEFFLLNFILDIIFYSSFLLIPFIFSRKKFSIENITDTIKFLETIILLQIVLILIQLVFDFSFRPGDWGKGSLDITDKAGFFIFLYILVNTIAHALVERGGLYKATFKRPLYITFMLLLIILIDAKLVYLSILMGMIFMFIMIIMFLKNFSNHINMRNLLLFAISISVLVLVVPSIAQFYSSKILKESQSFNANLKKYFNDPEYSQKYTLYNKTFYEMSKDHPVFSVFGVGMGKFGGKVSNAFAKDVLYKDPTNAIAAHLPTQSSHWVKEYYKGLYTKEVYETIKWRSANFSFPFAGLITMKVELGFIGLFFFLTILLRMAIKTLRKYFQITDLYLRRWLIGFSIYVAAIPILMLFDNYQEFPQIMIPAFLFISLVNNMSVSE